MSFLVLGKRNRIADDFQAIHLDGREFDADFCLPTKSNECAPDYPSRRSAAVSLKANARSISCAKLKRMAVAP
jgi:hypothetical protein